MHAQNIMFLNILPLQPGPDLLKKKVHGGICSTDILHMLVELSLRDTHLHLVHLSTFKIHP